MVDFKKLRKGTIGALQTSFEKFRVVRMEVAIAETSTDSVAWQVKMWSKDNRFFASTINASMAVAMRSCLRMVQTRVLSPE